MNRDPVKDFIKAFDAIHDHSISRREMFRDFMELSYCAYAKLTAPSKDRAEALEARYMQIVNRYPNKDTIRAYKPLLEILFDALEIGGIDFLGSVSSQLEVLDSRQGQFFTPYPLSRMMADMMLGDVGEIIEREGYVTIGEPASGSGGMILAAADAIQRAGYDPMRHMLVQATDVSPLCYWMTFMQLTARGVPAAVFHANSLSMEVFSSAWTVHAHVFQGVHGHLRFDKPLSQLRNVIRSIQEYEQQLPAPEMMQLSLFDWAEHRELREVESS